MRILVTGGAGFIGSNIVNYHLNKQDDVIVIDDLSTGKKANIESYLTLPNFTFYHQDLCTWSELKTIVANVDRIYHFAAMVGMFNVLEHPITTLKTNINSTLYLFETLKTVPQKPLVILASSSEVYGNQSGKLSEQSPIVIADSFKKHATYVISKLCDESIAKSYHEQYDIPCIVLRIFNTIGINQSGQYGMVVPRLIRQAIQEVPITIYGDGQQKRSFCNVKDLVNLIDLLARWPQAPGNVFNIGNDELISILDLARLIKQLSQSKSEFQFIPYQEAYSDEYLCIYERQPNLTKLLNTVSYQYEWSLRKTLKDLISHEQQCCLQ